MSEATVSRRLTSRSVRSPHLINQRLITGIIPNNTFHPVQVPHWNALAEWKSFTNNVNCQI